MAVIVLTSASGAPGVTTSAVGLALNWGSPALLVEADPGGPSAVGAGYWRAENSPTPYTVADLSIPAREGVLEDALVNLVGRIGDSDTYLLPSAHGHAQARGIASDVWAQFAGIITSDRFGQDVIIDLGRLGMQNSPRPLLLAADLTLLVMRTDLPSIIAAQSWARSLREAKGGTSQGLGLLLVGGGHTNAQENTYTPAEISGLLSIPVIAKLPDDPQGALVYSRGATPTKRRSTLTKDLVSAGERIRAAVAVSADALARGASGKAL